MERYKAIRMKQHDLQGNEEKRLVKKMKYYCQGRGCRHQGAPDSRPTAVCFYMRGPACSHTEVKERLEELLALLSLRARIESIQFVPLAVHLDTVNTDNRWVISMNSVEARNKLAGMIFYIQGQKVALRRYDDIIHLEYRKCSRATNMLHMVKKINNLDNTIEET